MTIMNMVGGGGEAPAPINYNQSSSRAGMLVATGGKTSGNVTGYQACVDAVTLAYDDSGIVVSGSLVLTGTTYTSGSYYTNIRTSSPITDTNSTLTTSILSVAKPGKTYSGTISVRLVSALTSGMIYTTKGYYDINVTGDDSKVIYNTGSTSINWNYPVQSSSSGGSGYLYPLRGKLLYED